MSLCWTQTVTASFSVDLPEDATEPISKAGVASLKKYLKEGQKCQTKRGVRKNSEKQQYEHEGQRRRGRRCSRAREEIPLKSAEETMIEQVFHCSP